MHSMRVQSVLGGFQGTFGWVSRRFGEFQDGLVCFHGLQGCFKEGSEDLEGDFGWVSRRFQGGLSGVFIGVSGQN